MKIETTEEMYWLRQLDGERINEEYIFMKRLGLLTE
jgi:hypothetical protein